MVSTATIIIIVVIILLIVTGIIAYFMISSGGTEEEEEMSEPYDRRINVNTLDGCPTELIRFGGVCRRCPINYKIKIVPNKREPGETDEEFSKRPPKAMCVHEIYTTEIRPLEGKLGFIGIIKDNKKKGRPVSERDEVELKKESEYKQKIQEIRDKLEADGIEEKVDIEFGPSPGEKGCSGDFEWIGGTCMKSCPKGYDPSGFLCKGVDGFDLIERDMVGVVGEFCPKGMEFNKTYEKCEETCRDGYEAVGSRCLVSG